MVLASGTRVQITKVKEVTRGTTPSSPSMNVLRVTGRNINLTKNVLETAEVRADRMKADVRHGFNQVGGSIDFELSLSAYDDVIENVLGSSGFAAVNIAGSPDLGATATDTFTRATGSFVTDGIRPGDLITTTGFSNGANNVVAARVLTVAALSITVDGVTLVTEAEAASKTLQLTGHRANVGTTLEAFTLERAFLDIAQYQIFRGVNFNTMSLSIQPESIVGGSLGVIGMSSPALSGTSLDSSPTAAASNSPFSSFDGALYEGGSAIAVVTGVDISIDNTRALSPVVGSAFSPDVFEGQIDVSGTVTVFFENATHFNKFVNETGSSIWLKLDDLNGTDFHNIVIPNVKYTGADIDPPQEGPFPITMPFRGLYDSVSGTAISFQRSNTS